MTEHIICSAYCHNDLRLSTTFDVPNYLNNINIHLFSLLNIYFECMLNPTRRRNKCRLLYVFVSFDWFTSQFIFDHKSIHSECMLNLAILRRFIKCFRLNCLHNQCCGSGPIFSGSESEDPASLNRIPLGYFTLKTICFEFSGSAPLFTISVELLRHCHIKA